MLIGVMSDTHDDIVQTKKAVSRFNREGVEQVLHAGDFVSPFMIDTLKGLAAPLTGVFGNNDGDRCLLERKSAGLLSMKIEGTFARIDAGGMRIALLHGNDRELLETLAACGSLDLLVYGHTHRPEVRKDGSLLIVNPGEVYGHLTGQEHGGPCRYGEAIGRDRGDMRIARPAGSAIMRICARRKRGRGITLFLWIFIIG